MTQEEFLKAAEEWADLYKKMIEARGSMSKAIAAHDSMLKAIYDRHIKKDCYMDSDSISVVPDKTLLNADYGFSKEEYTSLKYNLSSTYGKLVREDETEPFCPYKTAYCDDAYTDRCPGFAKCEESEE